MMLRRDFLLLISARCRGRAFRPRRGRAGCRLSGRNVRWVVGYPAGGSTDIIARMVGQ